jgi:hypothetical protein
MPAPESAELIRELSENVRIPDPGATKGVFGFTSIEATIEKSTRSRIDSGDVFLTNRDNRIFYREGVGIFELSRSGGPDHFVEDIGAPGSSRRDVYVLRDIEGGLSLPLEWSVQMIDRHEADLIHKGAALLDMRGQGRAEEIVFFWKHPSRPRAARPAIKFWDNGDAHYWHPFMGGSTKNIMSAATDLVPFRLLRRSFGTGSTGDKWDSEPLTDRLREDLEEEGALHPLNENVAHAACDAFDTMWRLSTPISIGKWKPSDFQGERVLIRVGEMPEGEIKATFPTGQFCEIPTHMKWRFTEEIRSAYDNSYQPNLPAIFSRST